MNTIQDALAVARGLEDTADLFGVEQTALEARFRMAAAIIREQHKRLMDDDGRGFVRSIVNHWNEFGPEHGFAETIHYASKWLDQHNV